MYLSLRLLFLFISFSSALEVCDECIPLKVQNSPGVGFDLTTGYGTVAVKLSNGSFVSMVKIAGSPDYVSAMKQLVQDAEKINTGAMPSLLPLPDDGEEFHYPSNTVVTRIFHYLQQVVGRYTSAKSVTPWHDDPWINAVAEMISQLKDKAESSLNFEIDKVILSFPTYLVNARDQYIGHFRAACQLAGVQEFGRSGIAARSVVQLYGIRGDGSDEEASGERPGPEVNNVLFISYSSAGLEPSLLTGEFGVLFPNEAFPERLDLGANSALRKTNAFLYWKDVRGTIRRIIEPLTPDQIERLVLIGDRATDPEFLQVLAKVFEFNSMVKPKTYQMSPDEHLFAAARGAAAIARVGLSTNWKACIPSDACLRNPDNPYEFREL